MMCLGTTLILSRIACIFAIFCRFFDAIGSDLNDSYRHWDSEFATPLADRVAMKEALVGIVHLHVDTKR